MSNALKKGQRQPALAEIFIVSFKQEIKLETQREPAEDKNQYLRSLKQIASNQLATYQMLKQEAPHQKHLSELLDFVSAFYQHIDHYGLGAYNQS